VVRVLIELGLTADDARALDNYALRKACYRGHVDVAELLKDTYELPTLGVTEKDIVQWTQEA
jgi:hypothetical protein